MARNSVTIQLILEGKDAKRSIDALEREFGDLERAGTKATDKVNRGLNNNTRSASTLEKTVKRGLSAAFVAAAAVGVRELSQLAQQTFELASAVEETNAKFATSLGDNVGQATAFINKYANALGLTNREAKDVLANQTNIARGLGFVGDEASGLAVEITTLAGDLASFNNVPIEQTLRAIQGGIVGEREALKTLGIVVRETDVQERALLNTRKESAENLTAQEKALASFELITERAGVAVGDLDRTQDSAANKARRLGAEIRELRDEIAVGLLNSFDDFIDLGLDTVQVFSDMANESPVEEIREQKRELNLLVAELAETNEGSAERSRLITKINTKYPDLLENVDLETTSNEDLATALKGVNEEFENRIIIQNILDDLISQRIVKGNALSNLVEKENQIQESAFDVYNNNKRALDELGLSIDVVNSTTEEQVDFIQAANDALGENTASTSKTRNAINEYEASVRQYEVAQNVSNQATESFNELLRETEQDLLNAGFSQERVNDILSRFGAESESASEQQEQQNQQTEQASTSLDQATLSTLNYINELNALDQAVQAVSSLDLSPPDLPGIEQQQTGPEQGSIAGIQAQIDAYKQAQQELELTKQGYQEIQAVINALEGDIEDIEGGVENVNDSTQALLGFSNLVGNAFLQAAIHGRELDDVLKGIIQQLASKAFILGLGTLITGGVPGGGKFLETLFSGFAGGVTNYQGGTALVGEEGPELVNLPRGSNVITNENTQRLIDSANRIASSPSQMATNVANTSVQNISQRVDMGGVSKEVGQAVSQAMSGARIVVGSTGELMVQFREESRRQKDLGGDSYIPFNDI